MKKLITTAVLIVSIVCYTGIAFAGVTPSNISSPDNPVTITMPGSYQLKTNLTVPANKTAILVTSDNVTIDLNGFVIIGPNVCTGSGSTLVCNGNSIGKGIDAGGRQNIKVYNGTVRGMGNTGILTGGGAIIENVRVVSNGRYGIYVDGSGTVSGNTVKNNYDLGIYVNGSGTVSGNMVNDNGTTGIIVNGSGTVSGNMVNDNGIGGIYVNGSGTVSGNTVNDNSSHGILVDGSGTVSGNAAAGNGGRGLVLGASAGYFHNVLNDNTLGDVGGGVNLGHNLCSGVLCP